MIRRTALKNAAHLCKTVMLRRGDKVKNADTADSVRNILQIVVLPDSGGGMRGFE
jgi:hypothetical protein